MLRPPLLSSPFTRREAAFPNCLATQRLEDLVAVRHEQITRRGLTYEAIFFTSDSVTGIELSAAR